MIVISNSSDQSKSTVAFVCCTYTRINNGSSVTVSVACQARSYWGRSMWPLHYVVAPHEDATSSQPLTYFCAARKTNSTACPNSTEAVANRHQRHFNYVLVCCLGRWRSVWLLQDNLAIHADSAVQRWADGPASWLQLHGLSTRLAQRTAVAQVLARCETLVYVRGWEEGNRKPRGWMVCWRMEMRL